MSRYVIVISEDAMVYEDLETLRRLPNFGQIWDQCARVNRVRSVYPTITYPAHATMMTGVYPDRHGIVNNEVSTIGEIGSAWEWFADTLRAPTVFDAAKRAGLSTAAVFWPVTGNHPAIDYLIDEYWPQRHGETSREAFLASGTTEEVARQIVDPNLHLLVDRAHPEADAFVHACACAMIREYRPNLLMLHPANIDAYRHETGVFSDKVTHALHEIDAWLGDILRATKNAGIYDDTDFFIVSDHGQMNVQRSIALNALLREAGLIETDSDGNFRDYTAFVKSCALSAQVYLKDPSDAEAYNRVYALLRHWCDEGIYGISRVYTAREAREEEHLAGGFSFVLESDGFTTFSNDWNRPLVRPLTNADYRFGRATHGYQPDKGPQPTLLAFGPDIQPGAVIDRAALVDEAPTFARALGVPMPDTDGRALTALFRR